MTVSIPLDTIDIVLSKCNIPTEIIGEIRNNFTTVCYHCKRKTPYLGKLIRRIHWCGMTMGQVRHHSIYHKKGGWDYPNEATDWIPPICYNCRVDYIRSIYMTNFSPLYRIGENTRSWCDNKVHTMTKYDIRLHDAVIEALKKYHPEVIDEYLNTYNRVISTEIKQP